MLFDQFFRKGLLVAKDQWHLLPSPILAGQPSPESLTERLNQFSGNDGWERFSRDSNVAPVSVKIDGILAEDGKRIGHSVHSAFVIHTSLANLRDRNLLEATFGKPSEGAEGLVLEEIPKGNLPDIGLPHPPNEHRRYIYAKLPLLSKVEIQGVLRVEQRVDDSSIYLCWKLEDSVPESSRYRSQYLKWTNDEVGKKTSSDPVAYSGLGGYMHIAKLPNLDGALLTETHLILNEPTEWFHGSNQLRSKLPLSIQESARSFRRKTQK